MCIICTKEIYKENLNTLIKLNISSCPNLTSEKLQEILIQCKNLEILWCYLCTSLTSLDLRSNINLVILGCSDCSSLTSIDLQSISEGVTSKGCIKLITLYCSECTSLTSLNLPKEYEGCVDYFNCPWICQNEDFSSNLQRLIKLQRWYRRILIIKYLKSLEFVEWIYNPSNIGGKSCKKHLKQFLIKS